MPTTAKKPKRTFISEDDIIVVETSRCVSLSLFFVNAIGVLSRGRRLAVPAMLAVFVYCGAIFASLLVVGYARAMAGRNGKVTKNGMLNEAHILYWSDRRRFQSVRAHFGPNPPQ